MASMVEQTTLDFIERWEGHGDEKQETQRFWIDLLENVLHRPNPTAEVSFEERTAGNGYIDALFPDARFLVEQKSASVDLDKPEMRQGTPVTPAQQAVRYVSGLPFSKKPSVICTCNFKHFRFYDLETDPQAQGTPVDEFDLTELPEHLDTFRQIFSPNHSRIVIQQQLSEKAGLLVANLHNALAKQYVDPDNEASHHALAVLTVRFVFCLYAEDANLFTPDAFTNYVKATDAEHLRRAIVELFEVLDTKESERDPYLEKDLRDFPYVNGGLFRGKIEIPQFSEEIRDALINAGEDFTWKDISPVIFGSLMEETLSHDQRRQGGMHYTTVKNIHRVIDPLFLDDLKAQLKAIEEDRSLGERARINRLKAFQDKLASLQFLDPACGSGNFLTETFLRLRELENQALADRLNGQGFIDLGGDDSLVKVSIDQMHGIEINDFAVAVAKTALWIAEQQALDDTEIIASQALPHLPLHDSGNIVQANALRYDWNELLPASECNYVMGNPPFIGHQQRTQAIKSDMELVCGKAGGSLDYVAGWYFKTSQYLTDNFSAEFAFVSTNSISQGQQVEPLFSYLNEHNWKIRFAHQTFAWNAQSTDLAHVHVVIIGLTKRAQLERILYCYDQLDGDPVSTYPNNINGYLINAPDVVVEARSQKIGTLSSQLNLANFGSMPLDGGNLLLNTEQEYAEAMADPIAAKYVRPFRGSRELINSLDRWCLWLVDAQPRELRNSKLLSKCVEACREYRDHAPTTGDAYKNRFTPWLFRDNHQPDSRYLCIPSVFSGRREYATCDWFEPEVIASNLDFTCVDPDGFAFAIIESSMFMAWQKAIGGRLKSDCRFSNTVVWNNLPLPQVSEELRQRIINAGLSVLQARANHSGQSLADLYDPDYMPVDLRKAHIALDKVVDLAFGASKPCATNEERLQILFNNYAEMTKNEK
ncbi:MAG TPA: class I SAM-dependent DNA methyltransferase [Aeriscardovia aeriphila]|uniref:site-specific DNA-methyltransferase (adenine-specific) n=1 Tax=Aeriscardovia aeriphila TaxID=218139 RepID=A0A921KAP6_9BIFI|nr:class I SAM-dependent DNA methyltransferase [Aeriscardovia aeriphila]